MTTDDTKPCASCNGTGEQYRPDLGPCYSVEHGDPWVDCPDCHGYGFEQSEKSRRHALAVLAEYREPREYMAMIHGLAPPWPAFYRADVEVHDMNALADRDADEPFGWFVRECGSTIVFPEVDPPAGFTSEYMRQLAREGGHRFYWWDSYILVSVTGEEFANRLDGERDRLHRLALRNMRRAS